MSLSGVMPLAAYSAWRSSDDLNVPSSLTVCAHGMDEAPGMCPGRWAVSGSPASERTSKMGSSQPSKSS